MTPPRSTTSMPTPCSSASGDHSAARSATIADTSMASRSDGPAESARASVSSPSISRCSRSISRSASPRMRSASCGCSSTSAVARSNCRRSAVSGVRSWCDASPAKRCCCSTRLASRAVITLNEPAKARSSGAPRVSSARSPKSPPATRSVLWRRRRSGPVTDPAMNSAATAAAASEMPATTSRPRVRDDARLSISSSAAEIITAPTVSAPANTGTEIETWPSARPVAGSPASAVASSGVADTSSPTTADVSPAVATTTPSSSVTTTCRSLRSA